MADSQGHLLDERLADLVSEYVDLLSAGTAPPVERYIEQHAEVVSELRPLLRAAVRVHSQASMVRISRSDAAFNMVRGRLLADKDRRAIREGVESAASGQLGKLP